jgi:hypothetical protein
LLSSLTLLLFPSSSLPLPYRSQLYSNELTGSIPSELAKLTGLTSLYVSWHVMLIVRLIVHVCGVKVGEEEV